MQTAEKKIKTNGIKVEQNKMLEKNDVVWVRVDGRWAVGG